jgi:hypothetical protein
MMQYPFAALIIACFVDVAGAQELPPANTAPVVLSEQRTQVWRVFNLNPDCTAADVIVAKVTKQGKGQVEFEENLGYSAYPKNSQKYRCNTQQTAGLSARACVTAAAKVASASAFRRRFCLPTRAGRRAWKC